LTDYASATAAALPPGHAASHVEVSGVRDESTGDGSLALLVLSMLALSLGVGRLLGRNLALDVELVTSRIEAMAEPDAGPRVRPLIAGIPQFSDLRALAAAVNELLVRITEIHVTHFVAIEKTLAADRVKMQFLANVSHDLRSPLNAILGFSELLLREGAKLGARAHTTVSTIHRAGGELLRLIDEVLDIAKLEAGRISLQREDSLPALILNQAIQEVSRSGLRVGVHISAELQAGLPLAWVDPHRLQQAIEHILRFCGEQLERGEISVRVRTETLRQPTPEGCRKMLLVRIADAGRGIEEEDLARLFVGFRRKPGVRGLGLGLPLARAMIEMHGGTLQVFSVPGVGTTFAADIPVMQRKSVGRLRPVPV
jgi:signal transduction histidine kinase